MASQSGMPPSMANTQPPYPPTFWALGGAPVKKVDIPAQTIFMVLFMIGAAVHMKIFQGNKARGHKFLPNLFIFGFCISRILTSILRLASASQPRNIKLAIAAQIFVAAGVLILFVINIIFSMRLVRSLHPTFGWHPAFSITFKFLCVIIGMTLIMVISGTVQSFYTLDPKSRHTDRELQLYGSTFLAIVATLPLPITILSLLIPYSPLDRFGVGRLRTKAIVLIVSTTLLSFGAWYRCGCTWATPVPLSQPLPSYLGKGAFYIFNFFVEIQTVLMYAILRVDLRWHVPDGAKGPGSYSASQQLDVEMQDSRPTSAATKSSTTKSQSLTVDTTSTSSTVSSRTSTRVGTDTEKSEPLPFDNSTPSPVQPQPSLIHPFFRPESTASTLRTSSSTSQIPHAISSPPMSISTFARPSAAPSNFSRPSAAPSNVSHPAATKSRIWRTSEHERVVSRLGGPWLPLTSPTQPNSPEPLSPASSTASRDGEMGASIVDSEAEWYGHGHKFGEEEGNTWRASAVPPSLPDAVAGQDWTPQLDWELRSPRRFLSMKKRVTRDLV